MKTIIYSFFALTVFAQFALPWSMIQGRERVLQRGELYRFVVRPRDPVDYFQGRYVDLNVEDDFLPLDPNGDEKIPYRAPIYVSLKTDDGGRARFVSWSFEPPSHNAYLKTRARGSWNSRLRFDIPFERYYMDENLAPKAEALVDEATRSDNCWVLVRIYRGRAVIEDVLVGDKSLNELVRGQ